MAGLLFTTLLEGPTYETMLAAVLNHDVLKVPLAKPTNPSTLPVNTANIAAVVTETSARKAAVQTGASHAALKRRLPARERDIDRLKPIEAADTFRPQKGDIIIAAPSFLETSVEAGIRSSGRLHRGCLASVAGVDLRDVRIIGSTQTNARMGDRGYGPGRKAPTLSVAIAGRFSLHHTGLHKIHTGDLIVNHGIALVSADNDHSLTPTAKKVQPRTEPLYTLFQTVKTTNDLIRFLHYHPEVSAVDKLWATDGAIVVPAVNVFAGVPLDTASAFALGMEIVFRLHRATIGTVDEMTQAGNYAPIVLKK